VRWQQYVLSITFPDPKKSSVELIDASRFLDAGEGGNLLPGLLDLHQLHRPQQVDVALQVGAMYITLHPASQ
jgi:hypothetical protein